MTNLDLPTIEVQVKGDQVTATHKRTKGKTTFPVKQLEQWLIRKLRDDLSSFVRPGK